MKILFLSGANNYHTIRWVNALSKEGHEVHLVSNKNHFTDASGIENSVIKHGLNYSGNLGYYLNALQVHRIYKKVNPDIVNAHYASGYGVLARMAKLKPLVLSVWGSDVYDFPNDSLIKKRILIKNINYADVIGSTSYSMKEQTKKFVKNDIDIKVTPFGVDTELFKPSNITDKEDIFVFGTVKALSRKYGIEYIIRGFKLLKDRLNEEGIDTSKIKLIVYGKGPMEDELKNLCNELKIKDLVTFMGFIPNKDVPIALNGMDVFCLGSILDSESFGVAAVEAMACELPVIGTDVSGFKEVIVNNKTGFVISRKNEKEMFEKMYLLYKDNHKRKQMGKFGRERVIEEYEWNKNVRTMIDLYNETIKGYKLIGTK